MKVVRVENHEERSETHDGGCHGFGAGRGRGAECSPGYEEGFPGREEADGSAGGKAHGDRQHIIAQDYCRRQVAGAEDSAEGSDPGG